MPLATDLPAPVVLTFKAPGAKGLAVLVAVDTGAGDTTGAVGPVEPHGGGEAGGF